MPCLAARPLTRLGSLCVAVAPGSTVWRIVLGAVCALGAPSCTNPVPGAVPRRAAASSVTLAAEPQSALDAVPPVVRFHASYAPAGERPELLLFAGVFSEYHARRVRDGDPPATLLERQVPSLTWEADAGRAVLAPSLRLLAGETYTVAALGAGVVGTITVAADEGAPYFARVWPPAEAAFAGYAVYCGPAGFIPAAGTLELAPASLAGELSRGVGPKSVAADRCFQVQVERGSVDAFALPPPLVESVALDPAPLWSGPSLEGTRAVCTPSEHALGPACLEVADDRLFVRTGPEPSLLAVRAAGVDSLQVLPSGGRFVVRGLAPSAVVDVDFTLLTASGAAWVEARQLATASPRPWVVINEVLANPSGLEPQQEWVEVVNDGSQRVDLTGFLFADGGGEVALPSASLEPGQLALIVAEDFQSAAPGDVPIPEACLLVRVPKLGKNGLSNAGESVRLQSAAPHAPSHFPALASPKAGVSLARREIGALDEDPSAFALHGSPGASPCAINF